MKILLAAVGKAHDPGIRDAIQNFTARIGHVFSLEWALVPSNTVETESEKIIRLIKPEDRVILLDERGKEWSSPELAHYIEGHMNQGTKRLVFIIGGAYGVNDALRKKATSLWSLSRLVFPHQIVRLILVEQLYRAISILRGSSYHHE